MAPPRQLHTRSPSWAWPRGLYTVDPYCYDSYDVDGAGFTSSVVEDIESVVLQKQHQELAWREAAGKRNAKNVPTAVQELKQRLAHKVRESQVHPSKREVVSTQSCSSHGFTHSDDHVEQRQAAELDSIEVGKVFMQLR